MPLLKTFIEAHRFKARLKEEVDPKVCITELVCCKNAHGKAFFAYIRIKPSEYADYRMKLDSGKAVNPNDYEILEYGWGDFPPAHVQEQKMQQFEQEAARVAVS
jgi:flagella basal body P-ring formation protein FlgA